MSSAIVPEPARLERLHQLIADAPEAWVVGLNDDASFTPPSPALDVNGHPTIDVTVVEWMSRDSLLPLLSAFEELKTAGAAFRVVRRNDGLPVHFHAFDVRATYGTFMLVIRPRPDAVPETAAPKHREPYRPVVCHLRKDVEAAIIDMDDAAEVMLGWTREELIGKRPAEFVHPDSLASAVEGWATMLAQPGNTNRARVRHRRADGSYLWVDLLNQNTLDTKGYVIAEIVDVSDEVAALEAVAAKELLLSAMTEALTVGVAHLDGEGAIAHSNARLVALLDMAGATHMSDLVVHVPPAHRDKVIAAMQRVLDGGDPTDIEAPIDLDGNPRICHFAARPLASGGTVVAGAVVTVSDVTDATRQRDELEARARFDALTQCHNRESILASLDAALNTFAAADAGTAVIFIDLDEFKAVNDRLGHAAGDELLRTTAERLRSAVRTHDTVGRLGGDEFLVVCPAVHSVEVASRVAERINRALAAPCTLAGAPICPRASVGVAWSENRRMNAAQLVDLADAAMYDAKHDSSGRPVVRIGR